MSNTFELLENLKDFVEKEFADISLGLMEISDLKTQILEKIEEIIENHQSFSDEINNDIQGLLVTLEQSGLTTELAALSPTNWAWEQAKVNPPKIDWEEVDKQAREELGLPQQKNA